MAKPKHGFNPATILPPITKPTPRSIATSAPRPRLTHTTPIETCDGQVTFYFLKDSAQRWVLVQDQLRDAYPDWFHRPETKIAKMIYGFVLLMGTTYDIRFKLKPDAPIELVNFKDWWASIRYGSYAAAFDSFISGIAVGVNCLWTDAKTQSLTGRPISEATYRLLYSSFDTPHETGSDKS